jgi:hypothetical protein
MRLALSSAGVVQGKHHKVQDLQLVLFLDLLPYGDQAG